MEGAGDGCPQMGRSPGCPRVPSKNTQSPPEQSLSALTVLSLCVLSFANCCSPSARLLLGWGGWWRVSRIPLCEMERTGLQGGGEPRVRGLELASREARHWLRSQGLGLSRELPAPHHSLPLPPRAPWLLSLPAGPLPSQTAARGRGRSVSEQRGPLGSSSSLESPFLTAK